MRMVEKEEYEVLEEKKKSLEAEQRISQVMAVDEEEKKSEVAQQSYIISGLSNDVQTLLEEIKA